VFGFVADRYGRLRALTLTVALFSICSLLLAGSPNLATLLVLRAIQGLGLGGEVPIAASYITEIAGARRRGRFVLLYELIFPIGLLAVSLVASWIVPRWGWRALFLLGGVSAALLVVMRRGLPESGRWLADAGPRAAPHTWGALEGQYRSRPARIAELFAGRYRRRTLVVWTVWFVVYLANYGITTWLPTLYTSVYRLPLSRALGYSMTTAAAGLLGAFACAVLIDTVGRKTWLTVALATGAGPLLALWWWGTASATGLLIGSTLANAFISSVCLAVYLYTPELYPTRVRAWGTSIASAWLRVAAICGPLLIGAVIARGTLASAFGVFALALLIGAGITAIFGEETREQALESVSP